MKNITTFIFLLLATFSYAQKDKKLFDKAMIKAESKDYTGAIKILDKAIEANNEFIDGYNARGEMYSHLHQHNEAIENYTASLKLKADQKDILFNRGKEYMKLHKLERAIPDFTKVIGLDTKHAKAYLNRGECYSKTDKPVKACEDWKKAEELGNRNAKALVGMKCK